MTQRYRRQGIGIGWLAGEVSLCLPAFSSFQNATYHPPYQVVRTVAGPFAELNWQNRWAYWRHKACSTFERYITSILSGISLHLFRRFTPAMEDDRGASHLVPGLAMPDMDLPSTQAGSVSLARAPGLNVCFFYPWTGRPGVPNPPNWDDIPGAHGSTPEAEGFRDLHAHFQSVGVNIFGLSMQETSFQREFAERLRLPFALLSDASGDLPRVLNLPTFETGDVTYLKRLTLLVRDGVLVSAFYPVLNPAGHPGDVLRAVRQMHEGGIGLPS